MEVATLTLPMESRPLIGYKLLFTFVMFTFMGWAFQNEITSHPSVLLLLA
jgi:hypothetical protein